MHDTDDAIEKQGIFSGRVAYRCMGGYEPEHGGSSGRCDGHRTRYGDGTRIPTSSGHLDSSCLESSAALKPSQLPQLGAQFSAAYRILP